MITQYPAKPIPTLTKCIEVFGPDYATEVHNVMKTSSFRNATLLLEQIVILQNECREMKIRRLIKLLGLNNDLYYKVIRTEASSSLNIKKPFYKFLLKADDEVKILQMILDS